MVIPNQDTATTVEDIQRIACGYFGIRLADLKSRRRHRAVSFPRMVAMYMCRQRLGTSYPELGERFRRQRPHHGHQCGPQDRRAWSRTRTSAS